MANVPSKPQLLYGIDDVPPPGTTIALGFQHYLTMFGSTVAIPLILAGDGFFGIDDPLVVGQLIGTIFFVSGIATLLQTTFGNRLPIVQGGTFSFFAPTAAICGMAALENAGWQVKLLHVQGAIIASSAVQIFLGYSGLIGLLRRFIGPITIAPTIALIGLALANISSDVAGQHWGIAALTIGLMVVFSQVLRRVHRMFELYPIVLAIFVAWAVCAVFTATGAFPETHPAHISTTTIEDAPWIRVPYPFQWGWPTFGLAATVGMLAGVLASMIESIGDYYACARLSGAPIPDRKVINRGIGMEGIGCVIAGAFGTGNGTTSYSENIGAIGLTRVGSRRVVQVGALLMLVLGTVGKFGAVFTTIPSPVVGGMYCVMFGMIAAVGLSNLQFVDLNSARNLFIVGFALFMGLVVPAYVNAHKMAFEPQWLADILNALLGSGMTVGALCAGILDNVVPGTDEERGLTAWAQPHVTEAPTFAPGRK